LAIDIEFGRHSIGVSQFMCPSPWPSPARGEGPKKSLLPRREGIKGRMIYANTMLFLVESKKILR
jgi:hypothetical protein